MTVLGRKVPLNWRRESIFDIYELALGLFLFVSPWLFAYAKTTIRLETWLSSAAVVAISMAALVAFSEWEEWLSLLLGVWLIVAPWVLGFAHSTPMHVSIAVGIVIVYLALLDLWVIHYFSPPRPGPEDTDRPM